jgi:hypothetical protein
MPAWGVARKSVSPSMETRPVPNATASASILEGYVRSRDLMFQMLRARIFASLRLRGGNSASSTYVMVASLILNSPTLDRWPGAPLATPRLDRHLVGDLLAEVRPVDV